MSTVFSIISTLLTLYMFVILFRIIMTWFPGRDFGRAQIALRRATDPYLNLFRRLRFLRIGYVDLSPIVGIIVLSVATYVFRTLAVAGTVSVGMVLALIVSQLGSAAVFLLILLNIVMIVRFVAIAVGARGDTRLWMTLDHLLQPLCYRIVSRLARDRFFTYRNALVVVTLIGIATAILLRIAVNGLAVLLTQIPF